MWGRIDTGAEVAFFSCQSIYCFATDAGVRHPRVDVIDADELVLHKHLAVLRLRDREIFLILQNLWSTCFLNHHTLHGLGNRRHGAHDAEPRYCVVAQDD